MSTTVVPAAKWQTGVPFRDQMGIGNHAYNVYNAGAGATFNALKTWCVTQLTPSTMRFELRSGDVCAIDGVPSGKERTEVGCVDIYPYGAPIAIDYDFTLEAGSPNMAVFCVVGQFHQYAPTTPNQGFPMLALEMVREQLTGTVRWIDANDKVTEIRTFAPMTLTRGVTYKIRIYVIMSNDANGRAIVTVNGVPVLNYSGRIGFTSDGSVYWQYGLYRHQTPETLAARYANMKITYGRQIDTAESGAAPVLQYRSTNGPVTNMAGSAKGAPAGSVVDLYDGNVWLGSFKTSAFQTFSAYPKLSPGIHILTCVSRNALGKPSAPSNEVPIAIDTAANILAAMNRLACMADLAAIVLLDTHVFAMPAGTDLVAYVAANTAALSKIVGGYSFVIYSGINAGRIATAYNASGVKTGVTKVAA